MTLTKAQDALLRSLENGLEVTFENGHYTVTGSGPKKIWPSTFTGLFDKGLVERTPNGNYTVSESGKRTLA